MPIHLVQFLVEKSTLNWLFVKENFLITSISLRISKKIKRAHFHSFFEPTSLTQKNFWSMNQPAMAVHKRASKLQIGAHRLFFRWSFTLAPADSCVAAFDFRVVSMVVVGVAVGVEVVASELVEPEVVGGVAVVLVPISSDSLCFWPFFAFVWGWWWCPLGPLLIGFIIFLAVFIPVDGSTDEVVESVVVVVSVVGTGVVVVANWSNWWVVWLPIRRHCAIGFIISGNCCAWWSHHRMHWNTAHSCGDRELKSEN